MADCAALEMLCTGNGTGGSNPPLSASIEGRPANRATAWVCGPFVVLLLAVWLSDGDGLWIPFEIVQCVLLDSGTHSPPATALRNRRAPSFHRGGTPFGLCNQIGGTAVLSSEVAFEADSSLAATQPAHATEYSTIPESGSIA